MSESGPQAPPSPPAPATPPRKSTARRAGRWGARLFGWLLTGTVALLLAAVAFGWWWSGTPQSLSTALGLASRFMPEGQTLAAQDVEGSVRGGGHIGALQWRGPGLAVEVENVELRWLLRPLLERRLVVEALNVGRVQLTPGTPSTEPQSSEPLTSVVLPIDIELPFNIQEIVWAGEPATTVRDLSGLYRYAQGEHQLRLDGVEVADGRYEGTVTLQGEAPMAITGALRGRIQAPMVEGTAPLAVQAQADVTGTLAQPDGKLSVKARVEPEEDSRAADAAMRATAEAEIAPWAEQPVLSAQATFEAIDAARFWPGAPRTKLSGALEAGPRPSTEPGAAVAWQADVKLENAEPGPWDKGRVPVTSIDGRVQQDGANWVIPGATLEAGKGRIALKGRYSPAPTPWQVEATIDGVQPDLLYSELDAAPVSGKVQASQKGETIQFDVALNAASAKGSPGSALLGGLRVDEIMAQGQYQVPAQTLDLKSLRVVAGPARISGSARARIKEQAGSGQLKLQMPGASAHIDADMAPKTGTAKVDLDVRDAAALQRWVSALPGLSDVFAGIDTRGAAKLDLRWKGGWQQAQQQLADLDTAQPGIEVQATLDAPQLDFTLPASIAAQVDAQVAAQVGERPGAKAGAQVGAKAGAQPGAQPGAKVGANASDAGPRRVQLRDLKIKLGGTPAQATLALDGTARDGKQEVDVRLRGSGGIAGPGQWRMGLSELRAAWKPPGASATAKPWVVELKEPLTAVARRTTDPAGAAGWQVETSGANVALNGPTPGTVNLQLEPLVLGSATADNRNGLGLRLRTSGQLKDVPLSWVESLGVDLQAVRDAGISGDIVFDAEWTVDALGDGIRANVKVARRSGDLMVRAANTALVRRIQTTGTGTPSETTYDGQRKTQAASIPAGVRRAEATVSVEGNDVHAQLHWDTERAGQAEAELRTRVALVDGAWTLPKDAPLQGRLKAQLPDIGAWSMFAPPAWRIDGSLAANATLSGTLSEPRWSGTLSGDGLSIRAAVEGIELRDGRLRATLDGNKLTLQEFSLQGGKAGRARIAGPSGNLSTVGSEAAYGGGELRVTGDVRWNGAPGGGTGIQMDMQAQLRRLRLLVRSDRQVTLSGDLRSTLQGGQIQVRGDAKVDRGVIILPDETAPSLGADITVRSAAIRAEQAAALARANKNAEKAAKPDATAAAKPPDVRVSVDMGSDFAVQGHGLTTRLAGKIDVRANAATGGEPRITGEISTVAGRYRAYGQALDVESGLARFNGPYDNPSLDILAVRPNLEQKAGVHITGTAQSPRVALYSQPQLTDAETLSWMLLGRSAAGGGAEAAVMQQAALALLGGFGPKGGGGNFASRLGLDEIGFKGPAAGGDASGSAITLGKRLTDQIYVTYEASLAGALGTLYIFYDLTRNLALRGQAGTQSGVDLIYTLSFD